MSRNKNLLARVKKNLCASLFLHQNITHTYSSQKKIKADRASNSIAVVDGSNTNQGAVCLIKADRYRQAAVMVGAISHEIDEQG
jgi:hypothetical protein